MNMMRRIVSGFFEKRDLWMIGSIDGSWFYASGLYTWVDITLEVFGTAPLFLQFLGKNLRIDLPIKSRSIASAPP